jgi:hypothetical protein
VGYVISRGFVALAMLMGSIDASKVPPSRFQKREGSIYATQGSRDGRVEKNLQSKYLEKLKEKKWS